MHYLDTEIFGIKVSVGYTVFGKYRAATETDPAEYPEIEVEQVTTQAGNEVMELDWLYKQSRLKRSDGTESIIYAEVLAELKDECFENYMGKK